MSNLKWDPEVLAWYNTLNTSAVPPVTSPLELRERNHQLVGRMITQTPIPPQIEQSTHSATSHDGTQVPVTRFATLAHRQATSPQPAVIYLFGGGLVSCNTALWAPMIANYVVDSGVQFFSVDYRLAPEHQGEIPELPYFLLWAIVGNFLSAESALLLPISSRKHPASLGNAECFRESETC